MARDYASNAAVLDAIRKTGNLINTQSLPEFRTFVQRIGYTAKDFDQLSIIHVSGTKGKGSTSAFVTRFCDRLVSPTPAIIDLDHPDKPFYFRYLTLMSFEVFLEEKVDVVILEVGVGGEFDSTNVIEKPVVCGITSLGFDHVAIWVIQLKRLPGTNQASSSKGSLLLPHLNSLRLWRPSTIVQKSSRHQRLWRFRMFKWPILKAISLGYMVHISESMPPWRQICEQWIASRESAGSVFKNDPEYIRRGLELTQWPGRCQRIDSPDFPDIEWFIDGAHTPESLQVCVDWFKESVLSATDASLPIYLVFNCTHGRDGLRLLPPLVDMFKTSKQLRSIVFCTNDPFSPESTSATASASDLTNNMVDLDPEHTSQHALAKAWATLAQDTPQSQVPTHVVDSVESAARLIANDGSSKKRVLVTGSLHLIGSLMTLLHSEIV
ncbi:hypothetical protein BSLG_004447 [Batrachochytrium salamandrivorans]|nr:hypothetical protein BSLG_004447 [Batrachochytrium salamandrivorans]